MLAGDGLRATLVARIVCQVVHVCQTQACTCTVLENASTIMLSFGMPPLYLHSFRIGNVLHVASRLPLPALHPLLACCACRKVHLHSWHVQNSVHLHTGQAFQAKVWGCR